MKPSPEDIVRAIYDAAEKGLRVVVVSGGASPDGTLDLGPTSLAALEEVQVNVAGEGGLATDATLAALLSLLAPGTPEQHVGTVDATPETVDFSGPTKHVVVSNPSADALEVSFDGGDSFVKVLGEAQLSLPCRVTSVQVRSTIGTQPYEIVATASGWGIDPWGESPYG